MLVAAFALAATGPVACLADAQRVAQGFDFTGESIVGLRQVSQNLRQVPLNRAIPPMRRSLRI